MFINERLLTRCGVCVWKFLFLFGAQQPFTVKTAAQRSSRGHQFVFSGHQRGHQTSQRSSVCVFDTEEILRKSSEIFVLNLLRDVPNGERRVELVFLEPKLERHF